MTQIYANGEVTLTVANAEKVAIFSNSPLKLYKQVGFPNYPSVWDLIYTTTAGETYTSAAMTGATVVKVEASAADAFYSTGAAPTINDPLPDQSAADATFTLQGLGAAQGGYVRLVGGTSSTAGNAGGAASLLGGQPGATGVGGAATITGGAGGATSGTGGAATVTAGAGTAGNAAGGAAAVTAGAGQGTGAGGAVGVTGGASGAGATGNGGAASVTGGAAASTNGNGGNVIVTPGAKSGTGVDGINRFLGISVFKQAAPTAKTTAATLTAAEILVGLMTGTHAAGATQAYTLPTGTDFDAATQMSTDDAFDWSLINLSAAAIDTITLTAGATHTIVGNPIVQSSHSTTGGIYGNSAVFRTRKTAANTFVTYRVA